MKVLITGGAGRIARWTALRLYEEGHEVVLFDRVPLPEMERDDPRRDMSFVEGDIMDFESFLRSSEGANGIVHQAGILIPQEDTFAVNTVGTWNALEVARQVGADRVVLASSVNALGIGWNITMKPFELVDYVPFDEEHPVHPEDSYSLAKYFNELTAEGFTQAYGIKTASMRYGGVRTPDQLKAHAANPPEPYFGPNERGYRGIWGYVDVRDVAQANCKALLEPNLPPSGAYYITAADTQSPLDTMELLRRFLPDWVSKARNLKERQSLYSSDKAGKAFGYKPEHSWMDYT